MAQDPGRALLSAFSTIYNADLAGRQDARAQADADRKASEAYYKNLGNFYQDELWNHQEGREMTYPEIVAAGKKDAYEYMIRQNPEWRGIIGNKYEFDHFEPTKDGKLLTHLRDRKTKEPVMMSRDGTSNPDDPYIAMDPSIVDAQNRIMVQRALNAGGFSKFDNQQVNAIQQRLKNTLEQDTQDVANVPGYNETAVANRLKAQGATPPPGPVDNRPPPEPAKVTALGRPSPITERPLPSTQKPPSVAPEKPTVRYTASGIEIPTEYDPQVEHQASIDRINAAGKMDKWGNIKDQAAYDAQRKKEDYRKAVIAFGVGGDYDAVAGATGHYLTPEELQMAQKEATTATAGGANAMSPQARQLAGQLGVGSQAARSMANRSLGDPATVRSADARLDSRREAAGRVDSQQVTLENRQSAVAATPPVRPSDSFLYSRGQANQAAPSQQILTAQQPSAENEQAPENRMARNRAASRKVRENIGNATTDELEAASSDPEAVQAVRQEIQAAATNPEKMEEHISKAPKNRSPKALEQGIQRASKITNPFVRDTKLFQMVSALAASDSNNFTVKDAMSLLSTAQTTPDLQIKTITEGGHEYYAGIDKNSGGVGWTMYKGPVDSSGDDNSKQQTRKKALDFATRAASFAIARTGSNSDGSKDSKFPAYPHPPEILASDMAYTFDNFPSLRKMFTDADSFEEMSPRELDGLAFSIAKDRRGDRGVEKGFFVDDPAVVSLANAIKTKNIEVVSPGMIKIPGNEQVVDLDQSIQRYKEKYGVTLDRIEMAARLLERAKEQNGR